MKYLRPFVLLLPLLLNPAITTAASGGTPTGTDKDALAAQAREVVRQYAESLQKTLKATIMTSGPASAVKTCKVHAPGISDQTAALTGWQVARTSDKVRNPAHRPNRWEAEVLQEFSRKARAGIPVEQLETYDVVQENGQPVFRYMKAIEVKNLCLNCHGPQVSGPVKAAIDDLYPGDQATGYRLGDLRGAFTLRKPLNTATD
ncbi:MAG: DUF3365 domain-containing protein [Ketobacteraceae bacterium]|nr:DUF3365 domain-containing protein [Ketobacteraceae bacterium]